MARKTLLTEAEIRQFMKLANIKPLQEMGMKPLPVPGMRDDELLVVKKGNRLSILPVKDDIAKIVLEKI